MTGICDVTGDGSGYLFILLVLRYLAPALESHALAYLLIPRTYMVDSGPVPLVILLQ